MIRQLQFIFLIAIFVGLLASFQTLASEPRYAYPETNSVNYSDPALLPNPKEAEPMEAYANAIVGEQAELAKQNAAQAVQLNNNTADIAQIQGMTGTQDFILKLVAIIMPLLIALMTGVMLYIQIKQKQISEHRSVAARDDLILVARSVNGMKTELVAKSELAAFLEATNMADTGRMTPSAEIRLAELQEAVRYATEKANATASAAIQGLTAKQNGRMTARTVPVALGEQRVVEGVDFGESPNNPEAIPVATGEMKAIIGVPTV